jgi:hypothetical protein
VISWSRQREGRQVWVKRHAACKGSYKPARSRLAAAAELARLTGLTETLTIFGGGADGGAGGGDGSSMSRLVGKLPAQEGDG